MNAQLFLREAKKYLISILNLSIFILGLVVIIGWSSNSPKLIQVNESFVPMQFNTALCFMCVSMAIFFHERSIIASSLCASITIIISGLTLFEYLLDVNLGIDELFMTHYITTYTSNPGRMAPNTAINFSLSGIIVLLLNFRLKVLHSDLISVVLTLLILGLSTLALWGYFADVPASYSWRNLTAMAIHTSIGFFIISITLFIYIYKEVVLTTILSLSVTSVLLGFFLVLMSWAALKAKMQNALLKELEGYSRAIDYELNTEFNSVSRSLKRLFDRVNFKSYRTEEDLRKDVSEYMMDMPSLSLISINNNPHRREGSALISINELHKNCLKNNQVTRIVAQKKIYACLRSDDNFALLNINEFIKNNLKKYSFQKVSVGIFYDNEKILEIGENIRNDVQAVGNKSYVSFMGKELEMLIQPTKKYAYAEVFFITDSFLISGLVLVIMLSFSLKSRETSKKNYHKLQEETRKKQDTEDRLQKIIDASPAIMLIVNKEGDIRFITKNCESLLLYKSEDLIGKKVEILISPSVSKDHLDYRRMYLKNPISKMMGERSDLSALRKDKKEVPVEISLTPIKHEGEQQILAVIMDRALHKKLETERREKKFIRTIYECSDITNKESDTISALKGCLEKICEHVSWPVGHIYFVEGKNKEILVSSNVWYCDPKVDISSFKQITNKTTFQKGVGLPGRVWSTLKPVWISDVSTDDNFPRAKKCKKLSLRGGAAFPIIIEDELLAVLEFFDVIEKAKDNDLINLFALLAEQIGRLLERKKAQDDLAESEMRNRLLLESAGEGIYGLDLDGITTFVNPAAATMLGYDLDELIGKPMHDLIHYSYPDGLTYPKDKCPMYAAYRDGDIHRVTNEVLWKKDKKPLWVEYISSPVYQKGKLSGAVVIFNDITERRKSEEKIQIYSENLKASNEALDDFAYIASHDLKEPLRGINNFSKILLEDYGDKLDEEGVFELKTLVVLSKRMGDLIESLLQYSRVGRQEFALNKTNLNDVLEEKKLMLAKLIKEKNVIFIIEKTLPTIVCDLVKIGEVFYNLILNAIKYNTNDKKIVSINYQESNQEYQFSITDNGIGIEKEDIPKIFKMFYRLHARDEFGGGTGAGMTIVDKIVKRHQGKVWVESEKGKGTTIFFTIKKIEVNNINDCNYQGQNL